MKRKEKHVNFKDFAILFPLNLNQDLIKTKNVNHLSTQREMLQAMWTACTRQESDNTFG